MMRYHEWRIDSFMKVFMPLTAGSIIQLVLILRSSSRGVS